MACILTEIRDRRLYESAGYEDFKDYISHCETRLGGSEAHVYRLIGAGEVIKDIEDQLTDSPRGESPAASRIRSASIGEPPRVSACPPRAPDARRPPCASLARRRRTDAVLAVAAGDVPQRAAGAVADAPAGPAEAAHALVDGGEGVHSVILRTTAVVVATGWNGR
jgi:hypothetical protein